MLCLFRVIKESDSQCIEFVYVMNENSPCVCVRINSPVL